MPYILPGDDVTESMNSLKSKHREVFSVMHAWVENYVQYNRHYIEPVHDESNI